MRNSNCCCLIFFVLPITIFQKWLPFLRRGWLNPKIRHKIWVHPHVSTRSAHGTVHGSAHENTAANDPNNPSATGSSKKTCSKIIMHTGKDGLGHQLLASFSCMVLAELDDDVCYIKRDGTEGHGFEHGCGEKCADLYSYMHKDWLTEGEFRWREEGVSRVVGGNRTGTGAVENLDKKNDPIKIHRCDHCFGGAPLNWCGSLRDLCGEEEDNTASNTGINSNTAPNGGNANNNNSNKRSPKACAFAKTSLSRRWSELAKQFQQEKYPGLIENNGVDVAVHLRGGDQIQKLLDEFSGTTSTSGNNGDNDKTDSSIEASSSHTTPSLYEYLDQSIFPDKSLPWDVFVENPGESDFLKNMKSSQQNNQGTFSNRIIREQAGGNPVETWLKMAFARKALVTYSSTFSVSASVARPHGLLTFSKDERPVKGRYDVNQFYCHKGPRIEGNTKAITEGGEEVETTATGNSMGSMGNGVIGKGWWWSRGHGILGAEGCGLEDLSSTDSIDGGGV